MADLLKVVAIPLDDIDYSRWHCSGDASRFGSGTAAAAAGQAYLLNRVNRLFVARHPGAGEDGLRYACRRRAHHGR